MKKCLLCNENDADKKGSHIVPHFLSKRIDSVPGEAGRDKELGFVITESSVKSYFGRGVQPEILKEVFGEVTDELISGNKVQGVEDYYFCTICEKKLGVIEGEYAKTLSIASISKNYISEKRPFVGFLFWISLIWRLSIHVGSGFKLKSKEEKKLHRILKRYLTSKVEDIKQNVEDIDLSDIGYKLLRAPHFSNENNTWLHWSVIYERPYSLIIDEFILFFYFKKNYLQGMVMDFYGSETYKHSAIFNTPFTSEYIYGISFEAYNAVNEKLTLVGARKKILYIEKTLNLLHQKLGGKGKRMDSILKNEILNRIANSDVEIGKKHTTENYIKIISETMIEKANK